MLRASRDEALTDALTGLGNRRALARATLDARRCREAGDGRPLVLALFDLDGFKHYNDTFGHPAGDALLVRLGAQPRRLPAAAAAAPSAWAATSSACCSSPAPTTPSRSCESAAAALSEHGEGFSIGCSYGSVLLPDEAADPAEALRIADQRMYAQKHAGRHVGRAPEQGRAAARARPSATPSSAGTSASVAELAERTARRLGLPAEEVERDPPRRRAARRRQGRDPRRRSSPSPARSTDEEWAFVRRHPLIGERIVPLGAVAEPRRRARALDARALGRQRLPRRPAADAIPLGSRIVAVADAFDAMTSERPYARRAHAGGGARRAAPLRRHAVRPGRGRDLPRRRRRGHAAPAA